MRGSPQKVEQVSLFPSVVVMVLGIVGSMPASDQHRRFVGSVYGAARRLIGEHDTFDQYRVALIIEAKELGKGKVSYATRLQIAKSIAQQIWDETHGRS